jgi:hypothetical protein
MAPLLPGSQDGDGPWVGIVNFTRIFAEKSRLMGYGHFEGIESPQMGELTK